MMTKVKTKAEQNAMREGGQMLATVLATLRQKIAKGMTTKDLADIAARELKALGGEPAFLGYYGFPDVLCISVNEEVIHGIPSYHKVLQEGDIVSMDFGVRYKGLITDASISVCIGPGSSKDLQLIETTHQALLNGIAATKNGVRIGEISSKIQRTLEKKKYGIVRDYVGHGVGEDLHEEPNIPNYGNSNQGSLLQAGMTVAIEPMATLGGEKVYVKDDGWTVVTFDNSRAAHFEHTVLITENGAEILTTIE